MEQLELSDFAEKTKLEKKMVQRCYRSVDYTELHTYKGREKELDTGYQTNLNGSKLSTAFPVFAYSMG